MNTEQLSHTEKRVADMVANGNRNTVIKAIKEALQRRSGKTWSVTGGRGTAWGWIHIESPPKRRIQYSRLKAGQVEHRPENYENYLDPARPGGSMTDVDCAELAALLGKERCHQGESIAASSDYYREYLHRAMYGNPGTFHAVPYWD